MHIPEQRKKLLLFTLEFPPFIGGVSTYNYELSVGLAELGFRVNVLTRSYPSMLHAQRQIDDELLGKFGITIIRKKDIRHAGIIGWYVTLNSFISQQGYDYFCMLITDIGGLRVASLVKPKRYALDYIITVHGSEIYTTFVKRYASRGIMKVFFPIFKRLAHLLYSNAKCVIFVSTYTKNLFFNNFKGTLVTWAVIHNGISPDKIIGEDKLLKKLISKKAVLNLVTISRLDYRKNHEAVINAIDALPDNIKNYLVYRIAGDGPSKSFLVSMVKEKKLEKIVRFTGKIAENQKWTLLDSSDAYIMPSKELEGTVEGLGISFLEAAGRGLPLIGGKHGGVPEIIIDGFNGYLVQPNNSKQIADAIYALLRSEELLKSMSLNSLTIAKKFTRDKMATKTAQVILQ